MGRALGAFADDGELDRLDLNKCPDCNCFFEDLNCPMCGKECPEEMRAGNRRKAKKRRQRSSAAGARSTFVAWYYTWWFIGIMLLFMPIIGIVLLATSPHERWKKVLCIVIAVIYTVISTFGIGNLLSGLSSLWDSPVDDSITKEEYIARCEEVSPEQFYRSTYDYEEKYITMTLRISADVTYVDEYYNSKDQNCYLCEAEEGSEYKLILRDCLLDFPQRFIVGDIVTVYGECGGVQEVYDAEYNTVTAPCLNFAYAKLK